MGAVSGSGSVCQQLEVAGRCRPSEAGRTAQVCVPAPAVQLPGALGTSISHSPRGAGCPLHVCLSYKKTRVLWRQGLHLSHLYEPSSALGTK